MVVLACDGTPIVDVHLNLKFNSSTIDSNQNDPQPKLVVLFIQYKHSKLEARTSVKISAMNTEVALLEARLQRCGWAGGEWLFLWVSNRTIAKDEDPDPRLLWVGKSELVMHAPLIGRRGLVPMETSRQAELEEDEEYKMLIS